MPTYGELNTSQVSQSYFLWFESEKGWTDGQKTKHMGTYAMDVTKTRFYEANLQKLIAMIFDERFIQSVELIGKRSWIEKQLDE